MDYTKEAILEKAIKKFDGLEELLKDCAGLINDINAEREVIRYLLFLGCEKKLNNFEIDKNQN